jgi:hypothetical protein
MINPFGTTKQMWPLKLPCALCIAPGGGSVIAYIGGSIYLLFKTYIHYLGRNIMLDPHRLNRDARIHFGDVIGVV